MTCCARNIRPAFSLVELIIVIAIIGTILAVAVPRFSPAAGRASEVTLRDNLRSLRQAIEVYTIEHWGRLPAADKKEQTFIKQLSGTTDALGQSGTTPGVHVFGPYVRRIPSIPVGPNIGATGVHLRIDGNVDPSKSWAGWVYNWKTGDLYANSNQLDSSEVSYRSY